MGKYYLEEEKENRIIIIKKKTLELWNTIKRNNIFMMGIPEEKKTKIRKYI